MSNAQNSLYFIFPSPLTGSKHLIAFQEAANSLPAFTTGPHPEKHEQFFCINYLSERKRQDASVQTFNNYLFESDSLSLTSADAQLIAENFPIASATFSGNKSIHFILHVADCTLYKLENKAAIEAYKTNWKILNKALTETLKKVKLVPGHSTEPIFDKACSNPSRLSRTPGAMRDNGNVQTSIEITNRYLTSVDLEALKLKHPVQAPGPKASAANSHSQITNLIQLEAAMKTAELSGLRNKLEYSWSWASTDGMYPLLFQYSLWAIDALNPPPDVFISYLQKYTFPPILEKGYSRDLVKPVMAAYDYKGT